MARLIIVSGASGAGKSFLLKELKNINNLKAVRIRKKTTRGHRNDDEKILNENGNLDLFLNCSPEELQDCDYTYNYCNHHYGFKKEDIDNVVAKGNSPVVIVASCSTVEEIKKDYPGALALYVQTVLSGDDLKAKLLIERDPLDVEERIRRQKESFNDYLEHINKKLFDYVLINNFEEQFRRQIDYVLNNELDQNDSNYVFVVMSFNDEKYRDVYDAFSLACELLKKHNKCISIERVDRQEDSGFNRFTITDRIEKLIKKAGLVICDVSEPSPNVYFELGYAKSQNKNIIITAKKETKLPFDTSHYEHIFYDTPMQLHREIIRKLECYFKINKKH